MQYPQLIEDWWINRTLQQLACESLLDREPQLQRSIQSLSDRFTTDRQTIVKDYFADEPSLCSYGLFYFPQSFMRTSLILQEILSRGWNPEGQISMVDLGSGSGAASLSVASTLSPATQVNLTAVDHSRGALTALQDLARDCSSLWPNLHCNVEAVDVSHWMRKETGKWDLILASFSLNEMKISIETDHLVNLLTDRGLLIVIEPALQTSSEQLEAWRDRIALREDLHIWAPCLHHQSCPLLREGQYWCHEVRNWQPPDSLIFFNRHLHRQIHVLKFSFLVAGKTRPAPLPSPSFRLISPVTKHKKDFMFSGCTSEGTKKDFRVRNPLTGQERSHVKNWQRGDIIASFSLKHESLS